MKKLNSNKCAYCTNCRKIVDKRNWVRYSCEHAPDIEFLGDFPPDPLNETCGQFKPNNFYQAVKYFNNQERTEQSIKETEEIMENSHNIKYKR